MLKGVMVLHGAGVGGGSLGYANVLEVPTDETFATPAWNQNVAWGKILKSHYETAKNMLGVARNPKLLQADNLFKQMADEGINGFQRRSKDLLPISSAIVSLPTPDSQKGFLRILL